MKFEEFDLDPRCLSVLADMGIETPTPVQEKAIPVALTGKDVIATAQTGTGKTLGFMLPSLSRLAAEKQQRNRMLVLVPTRELCQQVEKVASQIAKALQLRSVTVYGGVAMRQQESRLKRGCDVVVATPGRLLDHMGRGSLRFDNLEILVFDEADRMLDMGFLPDIQRILAKLPEDRQTMMFSATFEDQVERLAQQMLRDPQRVTVGAVSKPVDLVRQNLYPVRPEDKPRLILDILEEIEIDSILVFLRTKVRTERLCKMLKKAGHPVAAIHGDLSQKVRQKALSGFREGKYKILVATDVAARGLDIDGITHVINYDIPPTADDYVHRVGRTARAQKEGDAITFVSPSEYNALETIERAVGKSLPMVRYPGAPKVMSLYSASKNRGLRGRRRRRR